MSDKLFVVELPEELLEQAQSAHVDVRQVLIDALHREIDRLQPSTENGGVLAVRPFPTAEEVEKAVQESLQRVASGDTPLRQIGYLQGQIWVSDDFDDELPDSFWLGDEA